MSISLMYLAHEKASLTSSDSAAAETTAFAVDAEHFKNVILSKAKRLEDTAERIGSDEEWHRILGYNVISPATYNGVALLL